MADASATMAGLSRGKPLQALATLTQVNKLMRKSERTNGMDLAPPALCHTVFLPGLV
jgi:hypothetical protein